MFSLVLGEKPLCTVSDGLETSFLSNCANLSIQDRRCGHAWDDFSGAFDSRDPVDVSIEDYDGYFDHLPVRVRPDSVLFWSGTYTLVEFISKMDYQICSSFTEQSAQIVDDLGNAPWCKPDTYLPSDRFWASFSCMLGSQAQGVVFWAAAGERGGGTYRNTSFFSLYELAAMEAPLVSKLAVIDVHREGVGEACGEGTLITLENEVNNKMITYQCEEVYGDPTIN